MFGIIPPIALKLEVTCCGATQFALALSSSSLLSVCTYIPTRCALDRWLCTQIKKLSCIFPPQVPICGWAGHYICALIGVLSQSSSVHVTHMYYYNNHRSVRQFFNQLEPRPSDERCDGLCDRLVGVKGGTHGLWPASQPGGVVGIYSKSPVFIRRPIQLKDGWDA